MLDILTLTILAVAAFKGFRKGLIVAVFSVVAVVMGVLVALKLSGVLAAWMVENGFGGAWAPMLAYFVLFVGVGFLVRRGAKAVEGMTNAVMLGFVNRLAGAALFVLMAAVVWSSVLWLAGRVGLVSEETKATSKSYAHIEPLAPAAFEKMGVVMPFARDVFSDLSALMDGAAKPRAAEKRP